MLKICVYLNLCLYALVDSSEMSQVMIINLLGQLARSVTHLAANPGVQSLIPAWSHTPYLSGDCS